MTNEKYTEEFQKALNDYIKLGFNQDECSGFMHGFHKGAEAQQLIIADVSKCYTEKDMDGAYDKGFNNGNQRDLTGSLIEVL